MVIFCCPDILYKELTLLIEFSKELFPYNLKANGYTISEFSRMLSVPNSRPVMSDQSLKKINRRSVDIAPRNIHFLTSTIFIISQFVFL